jgi:hypothetical protein
MSVVLTLYFYVRRPPGCSPGETADCIWLYDEDHKQAVDLSLYLLEWSCVLDDRAYMEGTFFDVILWHVVF